jgi:hypothetical protein
MDLFLITNLDFFLILTHLYPPPPLLMTTPTITNNLGLLSLSCLSTLGLGGLKYDIVDFSQLDTLLKF